MYFVVGFFIFVIFVFAMMYNNLINKKNQVENAFGGMDAQLKKRYDLITIFLLNLELGGFRKYTNNIIVVQKNNSMNQLDKNAIKKSLTIFY